MEHIKAAMKDFLTREGSGVFVVKGAWGVGKTYLFNSILHECLGSVVSKKYSYVSLFGARSILDVKKEILNNCVSLNANGKESTANISGIFSKFQRVSDSIKEAAPMLSEYLPDSSEINFLLSINDSLICLDDLERSSGCLELKEVMGFASELKERKGCKVFLILNYDEIKKEDYDKYREKVVDYEFDFSPSPEFGLDVIEIESVTYSEHIRKMFKLIECSNIRVMKSAVSLVDKLIPSIASLHFTTINDIISSVILFCCVKDQCGRAKIISGLDYFKNFESIYFSFIDKSEKDEKSKAQEDFLRDYGFYSVDDKDNCLIDGVLCGYVDVERLLSCAASVDLENLNKYRNQALTKAWDIFRCGFDDNADIFVSELISAIKVNVDITNFHEVNGAVRIARELGYSADADSLIDFFVDKRSEDIKKVENFESLFHMSFSEVDSVLADKLKQVKSLKDKPDPFSLFYSILDGEYLGEDNYSILSEESVQVYIDFLKNHKTELRLVEKVKPFREMRAFAGSSRCQIYTKMHEALQQIASESLINKVRVSYLEFGL